MPTIPKKTIISNLLFSGLESFGTISINGIINAKIVRNSPIIKIVQPDTVFAIFLGSVVFFKILTIYVGINDEK